MKRYLTTPIYYASGAPHLGHVYTTFLADCARRSARMDGLETCLVTGTDEHGQKIERAAAAAGESPEALVAARSDAFRKLWAGLGIQASFVRTTDPAHAGVVIDFWNRLCATGDVYRGYYQGLYCVDCEQYFTGDATECPVHRRPLEQYAEDSYFFRLSKYQERLTEHIEANPDFVQPETRRNEVLAFLRGQPLSYLSVSRTSTSWGIRVPGDPEHVLYVWVDALVSYLSALGPLGSSDLGDWWGDAHHFIGKDILILHAVYWPAMLLSAGLPLPKAIVVNGWLTVSGRKIAKSDPVTVVDPLAQANRFGSAALAFYFLRSVGLGADLNFDTGEVARVLDADLANNLGNLVSRVVKFVDRRFGANVPGERTGDLTPAARSGAQAVRIALGSFETARAARRVLADLARVNSVPADERALAGDGRNAGARLVGGVGAGTRDNAECRLAAVGRTRGDRARRAGYSRRADVGSRACARPRRRITIARLCAARGRPAWRRPAWRRRVTSPGRPNVMRRFVGGAAGVRIRVRRFDFSLRGAEPNAAKEEQSLRDRSHSCFDVCRSVTDALGCCVAQASILRGSK